MTTGHLIPEALDEELFALSREINPASGVRWKTRELAAWLWTTHGVKCSHMVVCRRLKLLRTTRERIQVEALKSVFAASAMDALRRLEVGQRRLIELVKSEKDTEAVAKAVTAQTGALRALADLAGASAPVRVDVTSAGKPFALYLPTEDGDPPK
jgi:hypothetical protein